MPPAGAGVFARQPQTLKPPTTAHPSPTAGTTAEAAARDPRRGDPPHRQAKGPPVGALLQVRRGGGWLQILPPGGLSASSSGGFMPGEMAPTRDPQRQDRPARGHAGDASGAWTCLSAAQDPGHRMSRPWHLPGTCSLACFHVCAVVPVGRDHLHPPRSTYTSEAPATPPATIRHTPAPAQQSRPPLTPTDGRGGQTALPGGPPHCQQGAHPSQPRPPGHSLRPPRTHCPEGGSCCVPCGPRGRSVL